MVRGSKLDGGGIGVLTGRVSGDRGVYPSGRGEVNAACAQEKHLGTDPSCRHILTTVLLFSEIWPTWTGTGLDRNVI